MQGVVVPNVALREHDIEQFEDDPLEFIRLDLSLSSAGTDLATRRQAAADVLQALVGSGYEAEATEIVGSWIGTGLSEYEGNKADNWKSKDSAVYLLTAVATRGSTTQVSPIFSIITWGVVLIVGLAWCYIHKCLGRCRQVLFRPRFPGFTSYSWHCPSHLTGGCDPVPLHLPKPGSLAHPMVFYSYN